MISGKRQGRSERTRTLAATCLALAAMLSLSNLPATLAPLPGAEQAFQLRVLTYNIHHGEGTDGRIDLERIASAILSVKPDLVALQEVDRHTRRTKGTDQPAELARLTNMQVVFGDNIAFEGGQYGNAVLSRFPVRRHQNHALPRFDDGEQRGVLEVEVELPHGLPPLRLFATHLDHRSNDRERLASARRINELIRQPDRPATPTVLAGDLNDVPESPTLMELARLWRRPHERPWPTIPVTRPTRQIDYILFHPPTRWKPLETRVLDEALASDHRALLAVLELAVTVGDPEP